MADRAASLGTAAIAIPAARPVALEEQLVEGIARVILALKLVQPLNDR